MVTHFQAMAYDYAQQKYKVLPPDVSILWKSACLGYKLSVEFPSCAPTSFQCRLMLLRKHSGSATKKRKLRMVEYGQPPCLACSEASYMNTIQNDYSLLSGLEIIIFYFYIRPNTFVLEFHPLD